MRCYELIYENQPTISNYQIEQNLEPAHFDLVRHLRSACFAQRGQWQGARTALPTLAKESGRAAVHIEAKAGLKIIHL